MRGGGGEGVKEKGKRRIENYWLTETCGLKGRHVTAETVGPDESVEVEQLFEHLFLGVFHFQRGQRRGLDELVGQHIVVSVVLFPISEHDDDVWGNDEKCEKI